jgi:cytochrome b561
MKQSVQTRFGALAQVFHWATAALVLAAFVLGPEGSEQRIYLPGNDFDRQLHESLGLCVFVLSVLRILWQKIGGRPAALPLAPWMELSSKAVQSALYLLLLLVPLTAIAGAWLEGHPLTLLGGKLIASPVAISHDLGVTISIIHTWLGDAILWVAGAHALAAIYHHVVLKDQVLNAMLPAWIAARKS